MAIDCLTVCECLQTFMFQLQAYLPSSTLTRYGVKSHEIALISQYEVSNYNILKILTWRNSSYDVDANNDFL